MESPARNRGMRLLVGLLLGAALVFLIGAGTASAASCSGTIGPVLNERGREVPTFSFRCDMPIGGNYAGRLFQVAFSNRNATTVKEPMLGKLWLEDFVGQCDPVSPQGADGEKSYVECTALTDAADSVTVPAGTTITGTPWDAARDMPVCSVAADVTVYGWAEAVLASFPLRSTCPADWTVRNALTVTVSGNGTVQRGHRRDLVRRRDLHLPLPGRERGCRSAPRRTRAPGLRAGAAIAPERRPAAHWSSRMTSPSAPSSPEGRRRRPRASCACRSIARRPSAARPSRRCSAARGRKARAARSSWH